PIDHFFRTLAATHGENAVGIILSGTGSDGTLGIKEIKNKGGLTIAQDPAEAQYDGMPQSAISTGLIDKILPVKDMQAYLRRFIYTSPRLKFLEPDMEPDDKEKNQIQKVFTQIKTRTGRDFSRYKINTLLRRLQRRMQISQIELLEDYLDLLRKHPEEVQALSDDFLINVTNFFRDAQVFEYLAKHTIPALFKKKAADDQIRIWSVGCATGEEAYSLAILLTEEAARQNVAPTIQIFASDLHEVSLKKAREGFFPGDIKVDVSAERRNKFFLKEDGGYRIRKELREMVIFTPHNLMGDPPFSRLDMVVCRNLLIYLKREVQKDIYELFHYAINPSGFLVLGTSENLENNDLFSVDSKQFSVYKRKNVAGPEPRLPVFPRAKNLAYEDNGNRPEPPRMAFAEVHLKSLERYAPPSILLNSEYQVLHISESAGRYLQIMGGEITKDIFKLISPEMQFEMRAVIHTSREQNKLVRSKPIQLNIQGKKCDLFITARWIDEKDREEVVLVLFEEHDVAAQPKKGGESRSEIDQIHVKQTEKLEMEIQDTRQSLQAVVEEYETSREEMKASNEELQSANEELRSTMEELETSKEELQSMNEELTTLNQENRHKVEELSRLSNDLQNLMASTDIATLFLDRELRILRFTPKLGELFNVRTADHGRPISDQTHKLGYNCLVKDAEKVLKNLQPIQHEVNDKDGNCYFARILPYRSSEDRIEGVVITFVDISALKNAEANVKLSQRKYQHLFESIDVGFSIYEMVFNSRKKPIDYKVLETNPAFEKLSGLKNAEGKRISELDPEHETNWFETFGRVARTGKPERFAREVRLLNNRWHEIYAFRIGKEKDKTVAVLYTDIEAHKKSEEALKIAKEETERTSRIKEDFLAHMSHEIRTPLNAILGMAHLLLKQEPKPGQLENLNTLKIASENLNRLINDILDYSKIHAGKAPLEEKKINL
ncbi:MAG TPA: CheR family methyltransferase, partial [Prolixibacteraceae bacterium]|nr:CheR family methyltransferase [Prolixibacteraceae bacterium]